MIYEPKIARTPANPALGNVHTNFGFPAPFAFESARSPCGQTDGRTGPVMRPTRTAV